MISGPEKSSIYQAHQSLLTNQFSVLIRRSRFIHISIRAASEFGRPPAPTSTEAWCNGFAWHNPRAFCHPLISKSLSSNSAIGRLVQKIHDHAGGPVRSAGNGPRTWYLRSQGG